MSEPRFPEVEYDGDLVVRDGELEFHLRDGYEPPPPWEPLDEDDEPPPTGRRVTEPLTIRGFYEPSEENHEHDQSHGAG